LLYEKIDEKEKKAQERFFIKFLNFIALDNLLKGRIGYAMVTGMSQKVDLVAICLKRVFTEEKKVKALLLTQTHGLVWVYSSIAGKARQRLELLTPGVLGSFSLRIQKAHQAVFYQGEVIESFFHLKQDYTKIEVYQKILYHIDQTQWQKKDLKNLFALIVFCFRALAFQDPKAVEAIFLIKLLMHEGVLGLELRCVECGCMLKHTYRLGGEVFCHQHALPGSKMYSMQEEQVIYHLAMTRNKQEVFKKEVSQSLLDKLQFCFSIALTS